jgi:hypothetical protein
MLWPTKPKGRRELVQLHHPEASKFILTIYSFAEFFEHVLVTKIVFVCNGIFLQDRRRLFMGEQYLARISWAGKHSGFWSHFWVVNTRMV